MTAERTEEKIAPRNWIGAPRIGSVRVPTRAIGLKGKVILRITDVPQGIPQVLPSVGQGAGLKIVPVIRDHGLPLKNAESGDPCAGTDDKDNCKEPTSAFSAQVKE